jgi:hypothetical protein
LVRPAAARYVFLGGLRGSGRVAPSQVICKLVRPHDMNHPDYSGTIFALLRNRAMWAAGRAGDIAWFQFGGPVKNESAAGQPRDVGEYALHIMSAWTWRTAAGFLRADDTSEPSSLQSLADSKPCLASSRQGDSGTLLLVFDDGDLLTIEQPPEADIGDDAEHWRLFQPGRQTPHLVSSTSGIEWHEA